ncbi:MAG: putative membrane protein YdbT with pleckstrin-like domain [Candidatus Paceibacteria bacterium]|jgi:uncharacterized membrane protein YdbT with pleckstrin-like domain
MGIIFDKDEKIILVERKHWFIFATEIFGLLITLFVPLLLLVVAGVFSSEIQVSWSMIKVISFGYLLWVFFIWNAIFLAWTDYYLDVIVVTNQRIVDIDQKGLFRREVSTLHLSKIQDVTSEVHGILPTFLGYGDLHVQTAGQQREFVVKSINNPIRVRQVASEAIEEYRNKMRIS